MNFHILISNLNNPTLLFFALGVFAVIVKSDLEIPAAFSKFISFYLLFSTGFKGGQELAHSGFRQQLFTHFFSGLPLHHSCRFIHFLF
jgi:uncharacterized protein